MKKDDIAREESYKDQSRFYISHTGKETGDGRTLKMEKHPTP